MLTLTVFPVQTNETQASSGNQTMINSGMGNMSLKDNQGYDMGTAFIDPESQPLHFGSKYGICIIYFLEF
jgi:hypothetical protein